VSASNSPESYEFPNLFAHTPDSPRKHAHHKKESPNEHLLSRMDASQAALVRGRQQMQFAQILFGPAPAAQTNSALALWH